MSINPFAVPRQDLYAAAIVSKVIGKPRLKKRKQSLELLVSVSSDTKGSENRKLHGRKEHINLQIMNATEDNIQVPGQMLIGYTHSVSADLTEQPNATADFGNRAALKGRVSKEMR